MTAAGEAMELPEIPLQTHDDAVIRVRDFVGGYGDLELMRGVGFDIRRGEVFGVLGGSAAALPVWDGFVARPPAAPGPLSWRLKF